MESKQPYNLKIFRKCMTDIEAQMIVDLLERNGIYAIIDSTLPHSILPVSDDAVVLVREEDYEQALRIWDELEKSIDNNIEQDQ